MRRASAIRRHVGETLRSFREGAGWSQERLADEADLHRTYISSAEHGERNISVEALDRWLRALGVTWERFGRQVDRRRSGTGRGGRS